MYEDTAQGFTYVRARPILNEIGTDHLSHQWKGGKPTYEEACKAQLYRPPDVEVDTHCLEYEIP
jgi:hypothetical protein